MKSHTPCSALAARSHTVAKGESLSSIALSQYGDARLWFRIAQANALDVAPTAAAAGSIASQVVGMGLGVQEGFSWKGVALSALSGGVGAGLGDWANLGTQRGSLPNAMVRSAVGNALTQASAVVLGLQPKFDWRGVAASALGAGVGFAVGGALGLNTPAAPSAQAAENQNPGVLLAKRLATGLLAGTAAALARGGKVAIQQVATDAFGQALGNGVMDAMRPEPAWGGGLVGGGDSGASRSAGVSEAGMASVFSDPLGDFIGQNLPAWEQRGATSPAMAYGYENGMDVQSDAFMPAMAYDYENGSDVQSSRYVPPASGYRTSTPANNVNGLDLPEGFAPMGPAGDERLGERRLRTMGLEAPSQPSFAQQAAATTRTNQGLNEPQSLDASSNADARDLRVSNSYRQRMSVELAKVDAETAHQLRLAEGPSVSAWDGVSRDPYASDRINLEKAMILPPLTTAAMGASWVWGAKGLGTVDSLLGWKTTAALGGGVSGAMDVTMQLYDTGKVRVEQALFATTVGTIAGPLGATSKLSTNIVLGGSGAAINTQFQNSYYGDDKSLGLPVVMGGAFGTLGYKVGEQSTKGISFYKPERYFVNLNPQVPALFQPIVVNKVPQLLGVTAGGISSGLAPLGESAYKNLFTPTPTKR